MIQIWTCLNSQHSLWKVRSKFTEYPDLPLYISSFYGNFFDSPKNYNLSQFKDIDLKDFFIQTRPEVVVLRCQFNMKPCPVPKIILTRYGWCEHYEFLDDQVTIAGPQSSFVYYAAYNRSDVTTGMLQFVDGMTLFYSNGVNDDLMHQTRSTFALSNRLTTVALAPSMNLYLPEKCSKKELDFYRTYTRQQCQEECREKSIMQLCKCYPPYLPEMDGLKPCSFEDHASCIAPNFSFFNFTRCHTCPRECEENDYDRNVEYGKYHEPIHSQFFSELGGSTGLVLGISLLSIVQFLDSLITYAKYIVPYLYRKYKKRRIISEEEKCCQTYSIETVHTLIAYENKTISTI
ncbi:Oidioi.mRNA.OKI2018_I69.chr2.g6872.t1.cds [Oikopleura dioica]|uniref:Oidioi.mRNA.OKI2018_I69.chr2.g6872.t1.cds n=1 Tax=Oikopleura dioica TaxID=34765 RepID=A0ABN7T4D5_OIKDI|nr:Oidioi.mRNA.OKI2018_I69.chr2.g6872.t1.cds [Oikopleura dioica]